MRRRAAFLAVTAVLGGFPAGAAALRLRVVLSGSGSWDTRYAGTSPNPGGAPDRNTGHDNSIERWRLTGAGPLVLSCPRRCTVSAPRSARGTEAVTGSIYHHHVDGLYAFDSYTERCTVRGLAQPARPVPLPMTASVDGTVLVLTLADPLTAALQATPPQCPDETDPLDGFPENMFTPGFSFATGWGPDRWFAEPPIRIPISRLRAHRLTLRLRPSRSATPPRDCAVHRPAAERCRTGGSFAATLSLTALSGR